MRQSHCLAAEYHMPCKGLHVLYFVIIVIFLVLHVLIPNTDPNNKSIIRKVADYFVNQLTASALAGTVIFLID